MVNRALILLAGSSIAGMAIGLLIGYAMKAIAPLAYTGETIQSSGTFVSGSRALVAFAGEGLRLGFLAGAVALLYDLGHRFLEGRKRDL